MFQQFISYGRVGIRFASECREGCSKGSVWGHPGGAWGSFHAGHPAFSAGVGRLRSGSIGERFEGKAVAVVNAARGPRFATVIIATAGAREAKTEMSSAKFHPCETGAAPLDQMSRVARDAARMVVSRAQRAPMRAPDSFTFFTKLCEKTRAVLAENTAPTTPRYGYCAKGLE